MVVSGTAAVAVRWDWLWVWFGGIVAVLFLCSVRGWDEMELAPIRLLVCRILTGIMTGAGIKN